MGAFESYASHMLKGGYSPVPIKPLTKQPLKDKWNVFRECPMDEDAIRALCASNPKLQTAASEAPGGLRMQSWARTVLAGEVQKLASNGRGSRNSQLFASICNMGKYVHHGVIGHQEVVNALMGACNANGLVKDDSAKQCMSTIASGMRKSERDELPVLKDRPWPLASGRRPAASRVTANVALHRGD